MWDGHDILDLDLWRAIVRGQLVLGVELLTLEDQVMPLLLVLLPRAILPRVQPLSLLTVGQGWG